MEYSQQVLKIAEEIQEQLHQYVKEVKQRNTDIDYIDTLSVFVLLKLASLEEQVRSLSGKNQ